MIKLLRVIIIFTFALVAIQPVEAQQGFNATVSSAVAGLRLRAAPSEAGTIITVLAPNTQLRIIGRTNDNGWLEVITPSNQRGWVGRTWVTTQISLKHDPRLYSNTNCDTHCHAIACARAGHHQC
ncbi:MAG: SH3 domain-containing protein [Chloroflexi bacterium]|nr:SH3 domain-containing protein [Chloroflexota bacterium]